MDSFSNIHFDLKARSVVCVPKTDESEILNGILTAQTHFKAFEPRLELCKEAVDLIRTSEILFADLFDPFSNEAFDVRNPSIERCFSMRENRFVLRNLDPLIQRRNSIRIYLVVFGSKMVLRSQPFRFQILDSIPRTQSRIQSIETTSHCS